MSESSGEPKRKSVTRKQLYIALALIGAVAGFAVSAMLALKTPVPEETITASYDSNITYEPTSPASEQPVDLGLNQSKDRNNSASLDEASESEDNNTDADEVTEEAPEEECETPVAGSEYVVIVEIRHCEFAYFELDIGRQLRQAIMLVAVVIQIIRKLPRILSLQSQKSPLRLLMIMRIPMKYLLCAPWKDLKTQKSMMRVEKVSLCLLL
jgi:hypothetical protein